jgi:pentatricopeptide repeat protein
MYFSYISALHNVKAFNEVAVAYETMREQHIRPVENCWPIILSAFIATKNSVGALGVLNVMKRESHRVSFQSLAELADVIAQGESEDSMKKMYYMLKQFKFQDPKAANHLVDGLIRRDDLESVWELHHDMMNNNVWPRVSTFEYLIHACGNKKQIGRLEKVMQEICDKYKALSKHLFISAIISFSKCRYFLLAMKWFSEMKQAGFTWTVRETRSFLHNLEQQDFPANENELLEMWTSMKKKLLSIYHGENLMEEDQNQFELFMTKLKPFLVAPPKVTEETPANPQVTNLQSVVMQPAPEFQAQQ